MNAPKDFLTTLYQKEFRQEISDTLNESFRPNDHKLQEDASEQLLSELAATCPLPPQEKDEKSNLNSNSTDLIADVENNENLRICSVCHNSHHTKEYNLRVK